eukprot:GHVU01209023.1.p1 GENE.GHVU01209023.1~~GHVU01209023.1.p1  ORF type:complete len:119 (+),score=21.68 GHVU01209023.1:170-526(+)
MHSHAIPSLIHSFVHSFIIYPYSSSFHSLLIRSTEPTQLPSLLQLQLRMRNRPGGGGGSGGDWDALLQRYWEDDAELPAEEKFLRDYLLHEMWKGGGAAAAAKAARRKAAVEEEVQIE